MQNSFNKLQEKKKMYPKKHNKKSTKTYWRKRETMGRKAHNCSQISIRYTNSIQQPRKRYERFDEPNTSLYKSKNELLTTEIRCLLQERKQLYTTKRTREVKEQISKISKDINRQIKLHKKSYRLNILEKHITNSGAIKKAYKDLQRSSKWAVNMKNKKGQSLSKRPDIINEATEFYRDLYHSETTSSIDIINSACHAYINEELPTIIEPEIRHAIKSQKNNKSPGEDKITNELLKSMAECLNRPLQDLFNNVVETKQAPKQWSASITTLLHKKGDRDNLGNYRPISQMSNIYKIFSKILLNRLSKILDENQPREQAGFRKNFSTIDHIHVVTQLIEKTKEYGKTLYICFIDFTKAFDSLEYSAIWQALLDQGVDMKYVEILHNLYTKCSTKIRLERDGPEFQIKKGVRQGDPISPKIFSSVLEMVFRNINWESRGVNIDGERLSHLRFADDIAVFAENPAQLQNMIQELATESNKVGLSMNTSKTKILTNGREEIISILGENIDYVKEYIYLGQSISFDDLTGKEINRRIALSWKKYWSYKEIMKNQNIQMNLKRKLYEIAILPCLTYGCQTWALRKKDETKLAIHQRKMERSMLGIRLSDRISNESIREKTKVMDICERIRTLKWNWAGHVCRMANGYQEME
ncbi:hypothetical protein JYU34_014259 [Plutella xylostella]|uniref:Reverse transcriptase domain-containing protein n=1 Tax=Plutella xylostella TaxID=51655 RepID=A0ABQ7Q863_PLUXY|nr:hypothetical protein JYU34_014259 [Plutella xylostella]